MIFPPRRRAPLLIVLATGLLGLSLGSWRPAVAQPDGADAAAPADAMTNDRLGRLLERHFPDRPIEGRPGLWRVDLTEGGPEAEDAPNAAPAEEGDGGGAAPPEADAEQPLAEDGDAGPGAGGRLPAVLLVMTDARADRMRILMPIRPFNPERLEDLRLALIALHANYDRALDARYAVHDGVLWSAFIHPLGSLSPADLENALRQVQTLRDNTGTSYSSGALQFGGGAPPDGSSPGEERKDVI